MHDQPEQSGTEFPDDIVALLEQGEQDGCVMLSELESLLAAQDLEDEVVEELHAELERRGIEVTDDCVLNEIGR